ncbi:amidohydrolase family protein [Desertimonas flava]|uniref:amidohydrolase family protein n=1 Tax=Desertimonas flava TaxID=2064846 RepID=UPI000E34650C|nr:amidohydrolase family protein [Desertimonas flava]
MTPSPLFDTHAHVISDDTTAYPPNPKARNLNAAPFTIDQLLAGMDAVGVDRACVVQRFHYYGTDNSYVLDACAAHPDRLTPVVMLDGDDPNAPDELQRLVDRQPIGGIRYGGPALDSYDTAWLNSPGVMQLWEKAAELSLPVTLIMFEPHISYVLPALAMIAQRFPDTPIVIDHLGTLHGAVPAVAELRKSPGYEPYITAPDFGVTAALRDIGTRPNVHYKFSGINLGCLNADGVDPAVFLRRFVDEFGADRVVCGSDIGQTVGPYARLAGELRDATRLLTDAERALVLHDTAARIYDNWPS